MSSGCNKNLQEKYLSLDNKIGVEMQEETSIKPDLLMTFPYHYSRDNAEVIIETEEFSALCPWTGLPDLGTLTISYVPNHKCIELKSLKYYLITYRQVGIVQEHAANRILHDLIKSCQPKRISLTLDYRIRGGLHTIVKVSRPAERSRRQERG